MFCAGEFGEGPVRGRGWDIPPLLILDIWIYPLSILILTGAWHCDNFGRVAIRC
jgi:hypothetical protein